MSSPTFTSPLKVPEVKSAKPEIGMAPLIDVVFLLLIFFMVTTVFPENRGFVIEKPESEHSEQLRLKKLTFTIKRFGEILFQNNTVTVQDVERLVAEQLIAAPDTAILLQVDRRATTEKLIQVMDACKLAGADRIGIATKPHDSP
ncbi:MAG: biopolymer transporter ExbD [Gammaproteobacteria bacterium]|jgi:biopolymer transport protein ExbD